MQHFRCGAGSTIAFLVSLLLAATASADPAARNPAAPNSQIEQSFARFSRDWMQKLQTRAARARSRPNVRPGADAPVITYRGYAEEFQAELQATGHPTTPYIGLLHYTENLYTCADVLAAQCRIGSSKPVTDVFRLRDGVWTY
jgi:hypothetical protein